MRKKLKKKLAIIAFSLMLAFAGINADTVNVKDVNAGSKVYYAEHSKRYHVNRRCRTLARSRHVYKVTKKKAKSMGLTPCKVCTK